MIKSIGARIDTVFHSPLHTWINIPGHKVKIARQVKIIQLVIFKTHEVMSNEVLRTFGAQDVDLHLLIRDIGIRAETVVIQCKSRVRGTARCEWDRDFRPIVITMTPKNGSPFLV